VAHTELFQRSDSAVWRPASFALLDDRHNVAERSTQIDSWPTSSEGRLCRRKFADGTREWTTSPLSQGFVAAAKGRPMPTPMATPNRKSNSTLTATPTATASPTATPTSTPTPTATFLRTVTTTETGRQRLRQQLQSYPRRPQPLQRQQRQLRLQRRHRPHQR